MRRLSWIRPLVAAHATDFSTVAELFAGDPASPADWSRTIGRVAAAPRDRAALVRLVSAQLDRRGAPAEARAAAARLKEPAAVAVVTGQQAGLFGGPLYSLLKAITAIQLARRVEREHQAPAVAVFWVDSEDHDWDEVRTATVLDGQLAPVSVSVGDLPGAGHRPVAAITFDESIHTGLRELADALAASEFTPEVAAVLARHYQAGAGVAAAFARLLDELLGPHGLVVFDGADPQAKPLVRDLFVGALDRPGEAARLARQAGDRMARLGHAPQVEPAEDTVALFYLDGAGRRAIRRLGADFAVGDDTRPAGSLRAEARDHPERFSPNVLLRPIVQDRLFPTICYVAGPSELAYQAQLLPVYEAFGVEAPLLYSRASVTLADSAAVKFLDRSQVPFEALHARDDSVLNRLLEAQLPPGLERAFEDTGRLIDERAAVLAAAVTAVDPTLAGAADTTRERMRETLASLHGKLIQAAKRRDDTLRRQFTRTRALLFPDGHPQERVISLPFFLNRYGVGVADRLLEVLPIDTSQHYVLQL